MGKRWSSWTARIIVGILAVQLLSFSRNTTNSSDHPRAASIVVELNQAARSVTGITIKSCHHVCEYIFDCDIRSTCRIRTGTHAYSWS